MDKIFCGAGKALITPPSDIIPHTRGVMNMKLSIIHDDLFVRVIALKNANNTALIVSFDLDKAPNPALLIPKLSETTGVKEENILYFGIHTHVAPAIGKRKGAWQSDSYNTPESQKAMEQYEAYIQTQLIGAANNALNNMRPAKIGSNTGTCHINTNRNQKYVFKDSEGNEVFTVGEGQNGERHVDHRLFAMKICDYSGEVIATFINYAVHNVAMFLNDCGDGTSAISSDIGGMVSKRLEEEYKGSVCVWSSGAAGDANPIMMTRTFYPDPLTGEMRFCKPASLQDSIFILEMMSGMHAASARKILKEIDTYTETARISGAVSYANTPSSQPVQQEPDRQIPDSYNIRLHLLRIGDIALVGIDGELYSSYGKLLVESSPLKNTVVINHDASLLPTGPGYILDTETVAMCQGAKEIMIPGARFYGDPDRIKPAMLKCLKGLLSESTTSV
jgi:hypothetical protein